MWQGTKAGEADLEGDNYTAIYYVGVTYCHLKMINRQEETKKKKSIVEKRRKWIEKYKLKETMNRQEKKGREMWYRKREGEQQIT